jgi:hypothetical protein
MNTDQEFQQFKVERNIALTNMDMSYARKTIPLATNDYVLLLALHKARYECTEVSAACRHESAYWLAKRGLKRMYGEPLLPPGELPE